MTTPPARVTVEDVRLFVVAERDKWVAAEAKALAVIHDVQALMERHRARYDVLNEVIAFIDHAASEEGADE